MTNSIFQLEDLIEKTDPGEDWRVDPFLKDACKPVVDKACQDVSGGDARYVNFTFYAIQKISKNIISANLSCYRSITTRLLGIYSV